MLGYIRSIGNTFLNPIDGANVFIRYKIVLVESQWFLNFLPNQCMSELAAMAWFAEDSRTTDSDYFNTRRVKVYLLT